MSEAGAAVDELDLPTREEVAQLREDLAEVRAKLQDLDEVRALLRQLVSKRSARRPDPPKPGIKSPELRQAVRDRMTRTQEKRDRKRRGR